MLVYNTTKQQFIDDVRANVITDAIEYDIPLTNRRVDFILAGKNHQRDNAPIIVELKQ